MLQRYLLPYAKSIDETNFIVTLRDDLDQKANEGFSDGPAYSAPWLAEFWRGVFRSRISRLGVAPRTGSRVLDCCCGLGYLGETLIAEYNAQVTFMDLSDGQLASLRQRFRAAGLGEPDARHGDLLALPFAEATFDAVFGNSFLHHVRDVPRALREFHRVLRPGGNLVLLHEPSVTADFWESFPLSLIKDTSARGGFTDLWMFQPNDLRHLAVQSGFTNVRVVSTGAAAALILNWVLIIANKLGASTKKWGAPLYQMRRHLLDIDLRVSLSFESPGSSLVMVAEKAPRNPVANRQS